MLVFYSSLLETRRDQLILIFLEDVPKRKRSRTLQYLMKTKTYLKWPQTKNNNRNNTEAEINNLEEEKKVFWKRLKGSLSSSDWGDLSEATAV